MTFFLNYPTSPRIREQTSSSAIKTHFIYLVGFKKILKKCKIIVTIEESTEFYTQIPKSKATFTLVLYSLYFSNKSNIVIHRETHGAERNESMVLSPCLLRLHETNR